MLQGGEEGLVDAVIADHADRGDHHGDQQGIKYQAGTSVHALPLSRVVGCDRLADAKRSINIIIIKHIFVNQG